MVSKPEDKEAKRVDELIEELKGSNQLKALEELKYHKGEKVKDALIQSLMHKKASMRIEAAKSIFIYYANTNDDRVVEPLIQAMTDPDPDVRGHAVITLGVVFMKGDTRVISPLNQALQDQDPHVRTLAKNALEYQGAGEEAEFAQGVVAREPRTSGPAVKTKKKGCGRLLMLTCGVISLLDAMILCIGGGLAATTKGVEGGAIVIFTCMGMFSLALGVFMILGYRRLGKETGPEKRTEEPIPVASREWEEVLQSVGELDNMRMQTNAASELTALRPKILGFSQQYPLPIMKGGPGVAKAEKQIPWIDRTLKEAADALITGKDPFGNPITVTQIKNGLEQLISIVCDEEYLTFMDMIYEGIADPLKNSMQELKQIIERIPA